MQTEQLDHVMQMLGVAAQPVDILDDEVDGLAEGLSGRVGDSDRERKPRCADALAILTCPVEQCACGAHAARVRGGEQVIEDK